MLEAPRSKGDTFLGAAGGEPRQPRSQLLGFNAAALLQQEFDGAFLYNYYF